MEPSHARSTGTKKQGSAYGGTQTSIRFKTGNHPNREIPLKRVSRLDPTSLEMGRGADISRHQAQPRAQFLRSIRGVADTWQKAWSDLQGHVRNGFWLDKRGRRGCPGCFFLGQLGQVTCTVTSGPGRRLAKGSVVLRVTKYTCKKRYRTGDYSHFLSCWSANRN
jgi:hypothetical protein